MVMVCADEAKVEAELCRRGAAVPGLRGRAGAVGARARARGPRASGGCGRGARSAAGAAGRTCCCRSVCLLRRRDAVAVIGAALVAKAGGDGASTDR